MSIRTNLRLVHSRGVVEEPCAHPLTFDAVFDRYHHYVATLAFRLLGPYGEVEDAVQDVFFLCSRRMDKIVDLESARGWLAIVTVRVVGRRLRRARVRRFLHLPLEEHAGHLAWDGLNGEHRAMLARVYQILDTVPVRDRLAWSLRHLEGRGVDAVAEACGCSLATAKRRLGAVQQRLDEELGR